MDAATRRTIRQRAGDRCEYCQLPQRNSELKLQIEHVIPRKHHGSDELENLAIACADCNLYKGSNIAGLDPLTGSLAALFNPRKDSWREHFVWHGVYMEGLTSIGRVTIDVLRLNHPERLEMRRELA
jgi:hypothetical protein